MGKYRIAGGSALLGEVTVGGAKNAALGIIAAAVMASEPVTIENVPLVSDVRVLLEAIASIGAKITYNGSHSVTIDCRDVRPVSVDSDSIRKMRGSYYLVGALLGRYKRSFVALPGGCNIGTRPVDQHIKGLTALGANVKIEHGFIQAETEQLQGGRVYFDKVSVGATINVMLAATLANGSTTIENPAKEPHVVDVANFLNSMGANVKGAGTDLIRIKGVEKLHSSTYSIIPDQIEAGTFMIAVAATRGNALIKNVIPKHLEAITAKLREIGVVVEELDDSVRISAPEHLKCAEVTTIPYPGFPTDLQPQIAVLLTTAVGSSMVSENIFENRFKYTDELTKMGAAIKKSGKGNSIVVEGAHILTGSIVSAPDLRAGAALVIAGLVAEGVTTVEDVEFIERGYEDFEHKLCAMGAVMERVPSEHHSEYAISTVI